MWMTTELSREQYIEIFQMSWMLTTEKGVNELPSVVVYAKGCHDTIKNDSFVQMLISSDKNLKIENCWAHIKEQNTKTNISVII